MEYDEKALKIAAKITAASLSESGKLDEDSAKATAKFLKAVYKVILPIREGDDFSKATFKAAGKITAAACEEMEEADPKIAGTFFKTVYYGILPMTTEAFNEDIFKYAGKITAAACEEMEEPTEEKAEEAVSFFRNLYIALTTEECNGKYIVKTTEAGVSFKLLAGNNQVIGVSEVYSGDAAMIKGIQSVKRNAPSANVEDQTEDDFAKVKHPKFEIYKDKAGEFRFRLKASNGEIILASEGYTTKAACEKGIASVRKNSQGKIEE